MTLGDVPVGGNVIGAATLVIECHIRLADDLRTKTKFLEMSVLQNIMSEALPDGGFLARIDRFCLTS